MIGQLKINLLPFSFLKNGYVYRQLKRSDKTAMYVQVDPDTNYLVAFEVLKIRLRNVPEKWRGFKKWSTVTQFEPFPCNEDFGKIAWTYQTWYAADKKYRELETRSFIKRAA